MSNLTGRPPLGPKPPKPERGTSAARAHMARVAGLPCCACGKPGPSSVHHVICGRFSSRRASDFDTIALCHDCHQGPFGIHAGKAAWVERNGPDTSYLPIVMELLK